MESMINYAKAGFESQRDFQAFLVDNSHTFKIVVNDFKRVERGQYDIGLTTWLLAKQVKEKIEAVGVSIDDLRELEDPLVCGFVDAYHGLALRFAPMTFVDSAHQEAGSPHFLRRRSA